MGLLRRRTEKLDLLGISVHYLSTQFLTEITAHANLDETSKIYDLEEPVIRAKGKDVVCPVTKKTGASYVHSLLFLEPSPSSSSSSPPPPPSIGPSTIMLSYTWAYTIGDIINTLQYHCTTTNSNPRTTYVWICCLCINQHRVIEAQSRGETVPFRTFRSVFRNRVRSIGHVLAMMSPWEHPVYLRRSWCVFELYVASASSSAVTEASPSLKYSLPVLQSMRMIRFLRNHCRVTIGMPERERERFLEGLYGDDNGAKEEKEQEETVGNGGTERISEFFGMLGRVDVEKAEASIEEDQLNVQRVIQQGVGFRAVNETVGRAVREWAVGLVQNEVRVGREQFVIGEEERGNEGETKEEVAVEGGGETEEEDKKKKRALWERHGRLLNSVAELFHLIGDEGGEYDRRNSGGVGDGGSNGVVEAWVENEVEEKKDDLRSLAIAREALRTNEFLFGRDSAHTATSLYYVGLGLHEQRTGIRNEDGLGLVKESLDIRERVLGWYHGDTAQSVFTIGVMLYEMGEKEKAMKMHEDALAIRGKVFGRLNRHTADSLNAIAFLTIDTDTDASRFEVALELYEDVLAIKTTVVGRDHSSTANTMNNIACLLQDMGRNVEAMNMWLEALTIAEKVLGRDHPNTVHIRKCEPYMNLQYKQGCSIT